MSKSLGNVIDPAKVTQQMGAEIIRLWVMSVDTSADVRVAMETFQQIAEAYRKLRNTFRFLLANTSDFRPVQDGVTFTKLRAVDQYMLVNFNRFLSQIRKMMDAYDFLTAYKLLINFVNNDLSSFYMNVAKDILYIEPEKSHARRSMQTVFYEILVTLTKLLTPILPHTTEEVWSYMDEPEEFVQLTDIPAARDFAGQEELLAEWGQFMELRSHVLKGLESARNAKQIGRSLEAQVDLYVTPPQRELLTRLNVDAALLFGVSALRVHVTDEIPEEAEQFGDGTAVLVRPASGEVCVRCRMTREDIGTDVAYPQLCARCAKIVRENFPETIETGLQA